jgi:uncharacterized YigZ family protein
MEILTLSRPAQAQCIIKKSRFIGEALPCSSEEEAQTMLKEIKKREEGANHYCWGYVLGLSGEQARYHDDGEPRGTAGLPILDVIRKKGLTQTLVVVTRYFGGIKLGTGGLVRAYTEAAAAALDRAGSHILKEMYLCRINIPYSSHDALERYLAETQRIIEEHTFSQSVSLTLWIPKEEYSGFSGTVADISQGKAVLDIISQDCR